MQFVFELPGRCEHLNLLCDFILCANIYHFEMLWTAFTELVKYVTIIIFSKWPWHLALVKSEPAWNMTLSLYVKFNYRNYRV